MLGDKPGTCAGLISGVPAEQNPALLLSNAGVG